MIGRTISHYRVLEKLGEGGMGVVYKARDTRLNRFVALKVLRPEKVTDPDRKRRFIQEARSASALNHPHIITIHDIGSAEGADFIAMEYLAGRTLRALISPKGLPVREALRCAAQVADALAAAHAAGVIHRDVKPDNVMVTESGVAKVLDFGVAKLTEWTGSEEESTSTLTAETAEGVIVGTVAYMSPEQADCKPVDARSDIFSFGTMLYEMLTGRHPFQGATRLGTITAILRDEPPPAHINAAVPSEVERLVACCLEKDPAKRFQHAGDLKIALVWLAQDLEAGRLRPLKPVTRMRNRKRIVAAVATLVLAAGATSALLYNSQRRPVAPYQAANLVRATSDLGLASGPALSLDRKLLAYASDRGGSGNLDIWVQQLPNGQPVRRTRDPADELSPRFSPDGSHIVFARSGAGVFVMPALQGGERLIARGGFDPQFSPDGKWIAYWVGTGENPEPSGEIFVAPFGEGTPRQVAREFAAAQYPVWAPDGRHVLFQGVRSKGDKPEWWVTPVDGGPAVETGVLAALRRRDLAPMPGPGDWMGNTVVFSATASEDRHIWCAPLKVPGWKLAGPLAQLTFGTAAEAEPVLARDGRVAFSSWNRYNNLWRLRLHDAASRQTGIERLSDTGAFETRPSISADGKNLVFLSGRSENRQIWIRNLEGGAASELTIGPGEKQAPVIAPDGSMVAYSVAENGRPSTYVTTVPGPAVAKRACADCGEPSDWTRDATGILYSAGRQSSVYLLDVASGTSVPVLRHPAYELDQPRVSPDNRWIAFVAILSADRTRIFVSPFRSGSAVAPGEWVSVTDGQAWDDKPRWLSGDSLLYYSKRDQFGCLWKQRLQPATKSPAGAPVAAYHFHTLRLSPRTLFRNAFDIAVARNIVILNVVEITGNIWLADLPHK